MELDEDEEESASEEEEEEDARKEAKRKHKLKAHTTAGRHQRDASGEEDLVEDLVLSDPE